LGRVVPLTTSVLRWVDFWVTEIAVVFDEADQVLPQKIPFPEQWDQLPFSKGHVSPIDWRHWCDPAWVLQRLVQGHEVLNGW
jgi:hypothetical protein